MTPRRQRSIRKEKIASILSVLLFSRIVDSADVQNSTNNIASVLSEQYTFPYNSTNIDDCPLQCSPAAQCVKRPADFSGHPKKDFSPLPFHVETDQEGYSCACPEGQTGLKCDRPFSFCPSSHNLTANESQIDNTHVCYHGGKCIAGLDWAHPHRQQFCDCREARFEGRTYFGKYCETPALDLAMCGKDENVFCFNGATCKEKYESGESPCQCSPDFTGFNCEFDNHQSLPQCDLKCQNGGQCQRGFATFDDALAVESSWDYGADNHTFCSCQQGYSGEFCEIKHSVTPCDHSLKYYCTNGGTCKNNFYETPSEPCDCVGDFYGPHCELSHEMKSSSSCDLDCQNGAQCFTDPDDSTPYCACPHGYGGKTCQMKNQQIETCGDPSNQIYCFNGGNCDKNLLGSAEGGPCRCPSGFTGDFCQFRADEVPDCDLPCHQGRCVHGFWETHVNFTHCACEEGYYGTLCGVSSVTCGDDKVCLNGGTCITTEDGEQHCDCSSASKSGDPIAVAGEFCQYDATQNCNTGTESYFCVNGGTCDPNSYAGCKCPKGFSGPLCEYSLDEGPKPECNLECDNGGVCRRGNKLTTDLTKSDNMDFLHVFSNNNFEHCVCKAGYIGLKCETQVEVCGEDNHICLHGSKCLRQGDGAYKCDCQEAFTPESRYAGEFCQHHHTDICKSSGELQFTGGFDSSAFCVNDGVCKTVVSGTTERRVCDCPPQYFGAHCEFEGVPIGYDTGAKGLVIQGISNVAIAVYLILLCLFFAGLAFGAQQIFEKRKEQATIDLHMQNKLGCMDSTEKTTGLFDTQGNTMEDVDLL